jgi:hypothetical protein
MTVAAARLRARKLHLQSYTRPHDARLVLAGAAAAVEGATTAEGAVTAAEGVATAAAATAVVEAVVVGTTPSQILAERAATRARNAMAVAAKATTATSPLRYHQVTEVTNVGRRLHRVSRADRVTTPSLYRHQHHIILVRGAALTHSIMDVPPVLTLKFA